MLRTKYWVMRMLRHDTYEMYVDIDKVEFSVFVFLVEVGREIGECDWHGCRCERGVSSVVASKYTPSHPPLPAKNDNLCINRFSVSRSF